MRGRICQLSPCAAVACLSLLSAGAVLAADPCTSLQSADRNYRPEIGQPSWPDHTGRVPLVVVDSAHHNLHTVTERFAPFADILRRAGYRVEDSRERYAEFSPDTLQGIDVLVIANALNNDNVDPQDCTAKWKLPTPSAFTDREIEVLRQWVEGGGALLLIADHMPFAGAAEKLADAFGFTWVNGYTIPLAQSLDIEFRGRADSTSEEPAQFGFLNRNHPVLREGSGNVQSVVSFVGSALWAQDGVNAEPLLTLGAGVFTFMAADSNTISPEVLPVTPRLSSKGLLQGATLSLGAGRLAIFGEAGMFSAQIQTTDAGVALQGMNDPMAKDNYRFLLDLLQWLSQAPKQ